MGVKICLLLAALALINHGATAEASGPLPLARNAIDDQIVQALENLREHMITGWPELGIPPLDPLLMGHVVFNISHDDTHVYGNFTELTMNQLSTFTIDLVKSNLLFFTVDVALGLPLLDFSGYYEMLGAIGVFPVFGDGPFWLDALNMTFSIAIDLGETDDGLFGVSTLDIVIDCNTTDIHFENIMGGGDMADFVNDVLSSLGPHFLQSLEDKYVPLLEEALIYEINQILHGGNKTELKTTKDESVNNYFDLVFANMRQSIIENGQDPLGLPEDSDDFTVVLFNETMDGKIYVGNGRLLGLSTVHRAGNMSLLYVGDQDEVIWGGEVGLIDLETDYTFGLDLQLLGHELSVALKISFLHLSFETDVFLHQSEITFARCNITELGPMHLDEDGSGPLDTPLYKLLANTLLSELHRLVLVRIQEVICDLLENAFTSSG